MHIQTPTLDPKVTNTPLWTLPYVELLRGWLTLAGCPRPLSSLSHVS